MSTEINLIFLSFLLPIIQVIILIILKYLPSKIHIIRFKISLTFTWIIFFLVLLFWKISDPILIFSNFLFLISLNIFIYTFWSLISHGFTINLLLNLTKDKNGISLSNWINRYTSGGGMNYFTKNRLKILSGLLFIKQKNNKISITIFGLFINKIINFLKLVMFIK